MTVACKSLRSSFARQLLLDSCVQKFKKYLRKAPFARQFQAKAWEIALQAAYARQFHAASRTDWFDCAQHSSDCAQDLCHYSKAPPSMMEILTDILPWEIASQGNFARQFHTSRKARGIASKGNVCTTVPCKSFRNSSQRQLLLDSCMQKLKKELRKQLLHDSVMQKFKK